MPVKFTNNASATLASSITDSATFIVLTTGKGALFPTLTGSEYFFATLTDASNNLEIVKVTARTNDTLTVVRAQDGTGARAYAAGDKLELRLTNAAMSTLARKDGNETIAGEWTYSANQTFTSMTLGGETMTRPSLPAGTKLMFPQASAPLGWTQDTTDTANNRMLRVVTSGGGSIGGSHDPILNNLVPFHTHGFTTGYMNQNATHSHSVYDPTHQHYVSSGAQASSSIRYETSGAAFWNGQYTSFNPTGIGIYAADTNHTHSGTTDGGSSQTSWQPRFINMILCTKD